MKRIAIILVPIFLLISLAVTVYIVVTQRMEMRKKAEEVALKTTYGGSKNGQSSKTITDWCGNGGPFVEVEVVGTSYNAQTGVQTMNLKARRVRGQAADPSWECVTPTPGAGNPPPTVTRIPTATATIAPTATPIPSVGAGARPSATATIAPTPTGAVQGEAIIAQAGGNPPPATNEYRVPLCKKLDFATLEQGCSNASVNPNMCTSCDASDPGYFSGPVVHTIPVGQAEISFSVSVKKPANQTTCGCTQIDLHVWDVNYPGSDNMGANRQIDCNSIKDSSGKTHDYLYAVGMAGGNCTLAPATSPTATPITRQATNTPPPNAPPLATSTPVQTTGNTPTPNQIPLCSGLSATPNSGTTPLTVHFIGSGTDPDGPVLKWEFNYGDGTPNQVIEKNIGNSGTVEIDHTYTKKGAFTATFRIQDNNGVWSNPIEECSVSINTTGQQTGGITTSTPSATPKTTKAASASATPVAPNVPKSGNLLPTLTIGLSGLLILGLGLLFAL